MTHTKTSALAGVTVVSLFRASFSLFGVRDPRRHTPMTACVRMTPKPDRTLTLKAAYAVLGSKKNQMLPQPSEETLLKKKKKKESLC